MQPTVNFSFFVAGALRYCYTFYYRYIGKIDDNGYGNDIWYADVTEMVSWCEGNETLLSKKTKKLLCLYKVSPNKGACAFKSEFTV